MAMKHGKTLPANDLQSLQQSVRHLKYVSPTLQSYQTIHLHLFPAEEEKMHTTIIFFFISKSNSLKAQGTYNHHM